MTIIVNIYLHVCFHTIPAHPVYATSDSLINIADMVDRTVDVLSTVTEEPFINPNNKDNQSSAMMAHPSVPQTNTLGKPTICHCCSFTFVNLYSRLFYVI